MPYCKNLARTSYQGTLSDLMCGACQTRNGGLQTRNDRIVQEKCSHCHAMSTHVLDKGGFKR